MVLGSQFGADSGTWVGYNAPMNTPADRGLYRWEWVCLLLFVPIFVGFGWNVHRRSTNSELRRTDYCVYTRAAWAVRAHLDPYTIQEEHGWHYCYPPPFVLFMVPLADPPPGVDRTGFLPFETSLVLWYTLNLLLGIWAIHRFALAVAPETIPWSRRWWYVRLLPFDLCITGIGFTLSRGQVNIIVLALLAEMFLAIRRGRPIGGGMWLAAAGALKVFPGLLILYPLFIRVPRIYLGVAIGLIALMALLPAAVWGVEGAVRMNENFLRLVVEPGVTNEGDVSRGEELTNTSQTDSQAFHAIIHSIRHPDPYTRPLNSDKLSKALHYLIGTGMLVVTGLVARRNPAAVDRAAGALIIFGALCIIMVHLAPASHMHYYVLALPTAMGLVAQDVVRRPGAAVPTRGVITLLVVWALLVGVAMLDTSPFCVRLREVGLAVWSTVALWGYSLYRVRG